MSAGVGGIVESSRVTQPRESCTVPEAERVVAFLVSALSLGQAVRLYWALKAPGGAEKLAAQMEKRFSTEKEHD